MGGNVSHAEGSKGEREEPKPNTSKIKCFTYVGERSGDGANKTPAVTRLTRPSENHSDLLRSSGAHRGARHAFAAR